MRITELKRQAIKSSSVILELDAEDDNFKSCSKYVIYIENCFIISVRTLLFFDCFSSIVQILLLMSKLCLFSSSIGFQSPHLGKLLGTGGISSSSPTLKISDIPISAWNSMWQWNSQYPEEYWRKILIRLIIYRYTLMSRF